MRRMSFALVFLASLAAAAPAVASVSVIGSTFARQCYRLASDKADPREALAICDRALENDMLSARDRAATFVNRGILQMRARNIDAALADYDAAIRMMPSLAEAYVNKGVALLNRGSDDAAVATLTQALGLNPTQPEIAYYTRGMAHEVAGRLQQAYEDYRTAAQLKPDWPVPAEQLKRFSIERRPVARG